MKEIRMEVINSDKLKVTVLHALLACLWVGLRYVVLVVSQPVLVSGWGSGMLCVFVSQPVLVSGWGSGMLCVFVSQPVLVNGWGSGML